MPQLWPLGWVFLFVFFWSIILLMAIFVWWMSKTEFYFEVKDNGSHYLVKKWEW